VKRSRVSELKFLRALFFPRTVIAPSRTRALPSDLVCTLSRLCTPSRAASAGKPISGQRYPARERERGREREEERERERQRETMYVFRRIRRDPSTHELSSLSSPPSSSVATTSRREVTRRCATPFFRDISRQTVYSVEIYLFAGTRHLRRPIFRAFSLSLSLSLPFRPPPRKPRDTVCFGETRGLEIKMGEGNGG